MLRGFATVNYWADALEEPKEWYSELLGVQRYFERPVEGPPAYYEFRVGDYGHELGLIDGRYAPGGKVNGPSSVVMYWHVDDVEAALERSLSMGAREYQPITRWGEAGFVTTSVVNPFGNVLGVMYNPHYLEVLGLTRKA